MREISCYKRLIRMLTQLLERVGAEFKCDWDKVHTGS